MMVFYSQNRGQTKRKRKIPPRSTRRMVGRGVADLKGLSPSKGLQASVALSGYTTDPTMEPPYWGTPKLAMDASCLPSFMSYGCNTVILFFSTTNLPSTFLVVAISHIIKKPTHFNPVAIATASTSWPLFFSLSPLKNVVLSLRLLILCVLYHMIWSHPWKKGGDLEDDFV